jgi:hypothetical protein
MASGIWLCLQIKNMEDIALDRLTSFSNLTIGGLNALVGIISDPKINWEDPAFKTIVYGQILEAKQWSQTAELMVGLTSGTPSQVGSKLGELSFRLQQNYIPAAKRILITKGIVNSEDKAALIELVKDLREAGWPLKQVKELGWSRLGLALDKYLMVKPGLFANNCCGLFP